ncbi:MAG: WG repeat-containing protein, partial [Elusimicrobiota bacterium]
LTSRWDFLLPRFSEGMVAFVEPRSQRFGFLSTTGEVAIAPEYDTAEAFVEGLAVVTRGTRSRFIDPKGKTRVDLGTASASHFRHGLACA